MVLPVRRRIADTARAAPDRTALIGFGTDLAEQGGCAIGAAIDTGLLEPPDIVTESWLHEPRQRDLPRILASWQDRDLVPHDVAPEFVARSLRVWRANRDAARHWQPPPYTGPVDVFGPPPATLPPTRTGTLWQRRYP